MNIFAILNFIPKQIIIGLGIILAIIASFYTGQYFGGVNAKKKIQLETAKQTIEHLNLKGVIENEISHSDASSLCGSFGLSDADKQSCVRGLEEIKPQ